MRRFYLDDGEELVRLFKKVKSMGLTTSLDLVAVDPDSEAADMDWAKILERVLPYVDFFAPSIEELGYMLDRPLYCNGRRRQEAGMSRAYCHLRRMWSRWLPERCPWGPGAFF